MRSISGKIMVVLAVQIWLMLYTLNVNATEVNPTVSRAEDWLQEDYED